MKSSRHCALRWSSSAARSCSGVAPAFLAATIASISAVDRHAAALQQLVVARLDHVDARLDLLLGQRWQVWQARLTFSSGLRTQWSETLVAPSRM